MIGINVNSISEKFQELQNNTGKNSAALNGASSDVNKQLQAKSETRINTDNVAGSNSTSGFDSSQTGSSGTQQGSPELERVYTESNKEIQVVGTNINDKNETTGGSPETKFTGRRSIINPYHLVRYHSLMKSNNENPSNLTQLGTPNGEIEYTGLADSPAYKNPSTSFIINYYNTGPGTNQPEKKYSYSDFLYMKHYHPFNNNRLITLRRFMIPVYDECRVALKDAPTQLRRPIAQALNYLDVSQNSLNTLTKMTVNIETKDIEGAGTKGNTPITLNEVDKVLGIEGDNAPAKAGLKILSLLSGADGLTGFEKWTSAYDPWSNGPLQDLVYGPVNVITGSRVRDRGLNFSHTGTLKVNFEYSSKTLEHVNQKAAMLDILSNMLALTYNHAQFWGGENRFLIERSNFPLVRAEVMYKFLKDVNAGKSLDGTTEALGSSANNVMEKYSDFLKNFGTGDINSIFSKDNLASMAKFFTQYSLLDNTALKTYQKTILEQTKGVLTGAPTGEWHLQVGNPLAPIMMIGNLWCTKCDFEFNNDLSVDDFPTELKFSCELSPGRDRDAGDIQSIFNTGGGRIYYPQSGSEDVYASSSTFNSEMAGTLKSNEVLNSTARFNVDRNNQKISDLVKVPQNNEVYNRYATNLFRPIKTLK